MEPSLIIQLQRMGDLVLSFPLFSWLVGLEPERPVWVVAEPGFYEALVPLAPSVVFFPPQAEERLRATRLHQVINLSHRPEAARMAGSMLTERRLGAYTENGITRVEGDWHLYRASLVHNNRHNLFHWADLNALDSIPPPALRHSGWPHPRPPRGNGRVGLFVGASESAKRPDPVFWGELAAQLVKRGYKPVFLGGETEKDLGAQAAASSGLPHSNLCGRFTLPELVSFLAELDMLVTPDTGPMHIGAWAGTLTLNLSMGPVNAWETAPFPPEHFVLRPTVSCTGCWQCPRDTPPCREHFTPGRVASLIHSLIRPGDLHPPALPGLSLLRTARNAQGMFELLFVSPPSAGVLTRYALGDFWRQWFLERLGGPPSQLVTALARMKSVHPQALESLRRRLPRWQAGIAASLRSRILPQDFWSGTPPLLRPLAGYLQLYLENQDFRREAWLAALEHTEHLAQTLRA